MEQQRIVVPGTITEAIVGVLLGNDLAENPRREQVLDLDWHNLVLVEYPVPVDALSLATPRDHRVARNWIRFQRFTVGD